MKTINTSTKEKAGAATPARIHNTTNEVVTMDSIKFESTKITLSTYQASVPVRGEAASIREAASAARRIHTDFAWGRLAEGMTASTESKADAACIMKATWDALDEHAHAVAFGYKAGLALAGPAAQRHAAEMDLAPISLPVGEASTWTSVRSYEQLREVLRENPELVDRLKATGRAAKGKDALHAAWAAAPSFLRSEIVKRACATRFARPEQIAVINRARVKAAAYRDLDALDSNGRAAQVRSGAERALQHGLKLALQWADSAAFWETAPLPKEPENREEEAYVGEEDWAHSAPLATYTVQGKTLGERWDSRRDIQELIAADYAAAAEDAEALVDALAAAFEGAGITPVWGYERLGDDQFREITSKEEMLDILEAAADARAAKRAAADLGFEAKDQTGLRDAVLAAFTEEQKAALLALAGGAQ